MADTNALSVSVAAMSLSANEVAVDTAPFNLPTRSNLPLPRELRDLIWGYLLRHEYVRTGLYRDRPTSKRGSASEKHNRYLSLAHTFKFHTNILAVNRSIQEECLQVLESNEFIIVSYKVPVTGECKHISSLPIVTENLGDCARFKHHVLRIHLQGSTQCMAQCLAERHQKAFCIVASDLSRFCRLLQHHILSHMPSSAPLVCRGQEDPKKVSALYEVAPMVGQNFYFRTNVQFLDNDVTTDAAKRLLIPFQQLVHGNQRFNVQNCPSGLATELQHIKEVMGPSKIWIKAMVWHAIQNVHEEMTETEIVVKSGDFENALKRYEAIMRFASAPFFFNLPAVAYCSENTYALSLLALCLVDAGTTEMTILMRIGEHSSKRRKTLGRELVKLAKFVTDLPTEPRDRVVTAFEGFEKTYDGPPPVIARATWFLQMVDLSARSLPRSLMGLEMIYPALHGDINFDHDLHFLRELSANKKLCATLLDGDGYKPGAISSTSACSLPVRIYYKPVLERCKVPAGLEGFVDQGHLARLRKEGFPG